MMSVCCDAGCWCDGVVLTRDDCVVMCCCAVCAWADEHDDDDCDMLRDGMCSVCKCYECAELG